MLPEKLLNTAIDHFGRFGFEGASTREIAKASGTAMSSITYHFGGKEGLYLAAADHIATGIMAVQGDRVAAARAAGRASRNAAIQGVLGVIDGFALMMLSAEAAPWARFITREQQYPTEAFDRLYDGAMRSLSEAIVELVSRARPDLTEAEAKATTILLIGQALVLRAGRASVCRVMAVDRVDDATATLLRARLRANTLCILSETPQ